MDKKPAELARAVALDGEIVEAYENRLSLLRRYLSERGKIIGRRQTGVCAKHQRMLSKEIKKAR